MKKKILAFALFVAAGLAATPQAVVFDWGDVIASNNREIVVDFMCKTFQFSETDFESANLEKRKAVKAGKLEVEFWLHLAKEKNISLPADWPSAYTSTLKASIGADPEMYAIIDALKAKKIRVGLLSNINDRYTKMIRDFGFYEPFSPCLLSCEIQLEKPDPKAYEALLKAIELPAETIVFIDDKIENVEGAKKMGIDAFVFESAAQVRTELAKRGL